MNVYIDLPHKNLPLILHVLKCLSITIIFLYQDYYLMYF